jgi:hypothetical protein
MKLLQILHPTVNQKKVLAIIIAAPTSVVALANISTNPNIVAARDMLVKLGVIQLIDGGAIITDSGTKIAKDENIIDEVGELTPSGTALVTS